MYSGSLVYVAVLIDDNHFWHTDSGDHGGEEKECEDDDHGEADFRDELVLAEVLA
jgi:hypothetical protein